MSAYGGAGIKGGSFKFQGGASLYTSQTGQGYNQAAYNNAAAVNANTNAQKENGAKLKDFQNWIQKLVDWIEVLRNTLQTQIDQYNKQAEYANGYTNKNKYIDSAQKTTQTLIDKNWEAQARYARQLEKIESEAVKKGLVKKGDAPKIIDKIKNGMIDIREYDEGQREFITTYTTWYEKLQDCKNAQIELLQSVKELQQTRMDNIIEQYESIADIIEASSSYAEAYVKYNNSIGKNINNDKTIKSIEKQRDDQNTLVGQLKNTRDAYIEERNRAKSIFGEYSNEYRATTAKLKEFETQIKEAETSVKEFDKQLKDLDLTVISYVMDRLKAFGDRLSNIVNLKTARGNTLTSSDYQRQITNNNDLIAKYWADITQRQNYIREKGWEINSENYKEYASAIEQDRNEIINLLNANETLKDSIEQLRWKAFDELHQKLTDAASDYDHLRSLIKSSELFDYNDDTIITDKGLANITLLARQLDVAKREIVNYRNGLAALQKERSLNNITQEEYNEKSREYIGIIQQQVTNVETYKNALADMYKTQITNETKAIQDYINKRKESLQVEKRYHDYQKSIKKDKDNINQLRAQINALTGTYNEAGRAELARLRERLKEAQDDLEETRYQHSVEMQNTGYDKMSEDAQKTLDDTIKKIDGDSQTFQNIVDLMLGKVKNNYKDTYNTISNIIKETGTVVGKEADNAVSKWERAAAAIKNAMGNISSVISTNLDNKAVSKSDTGLGTKINTDRASNNTAKNYATRQTTTQSEIYPGKFNVVPSKKSVVETGKQIKPSVKVTANNKTVSSGSYTVTYSNNIKPGNATISVKGKGTYAGWTGSTTFTITKKKSTTKTKTSTTSSKSSSNKNTQTKAMYEDREPTKGVISSVGGTEKLPTANETLVNKIKTVVRKFAVPNPKPTTTEQKKKSTLWQHIFSKSGRSATDKDLVTLYNTVFGKKLTVARLTDAQKSELEKKLKAVGYSKGTEGIKTDEINWTHNGELIRKDGAILRQLPSGTQVIPKLASQNIMKWAELDPAVLRGMGGVINNNQKETVNVNSPLIVVNGNADADTVRDLERIAKDLLHNKAFTQGMTSAVNRENRKDASKLGYR